MRSDSDAVTTLMVAGEVNNTTQPSEPLISEKGGAEHAIPWKDIGRTLGCVFLSTLACLTVNPAVPLGWHLRFSGQIVVIGLLLTLMLQFIVSDMVKSAFLLYEFRFGRRNKKFFRLGRG
ncbi:hypothetical protein CEP53_001567 [Fusarium sp. AF-6]|nr:hypothetical protein CEP53_001567 [Fusarium sp. AF-6]